MKERAGDVELINPCGRIPLIFQCTLGSGELPKWGLKIPCAIGRFKFQTCLEPRLPQELRKLYYSELKIPKSCFIWSLKGGGKGQKSIGIGFVWGTLRSLRAVSQRQQQGGDSCRLTLGSPSSPSTSWMFILCSHLDLLLCGISSHFRGLLKAIPRADQGILRGIRVILTHPCVIYCTCSHQEPRTDVLDPTRHPFVPIIRKPPSPPPQNKQTGIKGIITLQNEPELHWYAECIPC